MSEIVFGADATNVLSIDIERYLLSYKANKYFEASFGRYHTSIGYYSTAFHHGTWFQTATGRPFMYFFEDSGGMLPVHSVGVSLTGLVPGTDRLGLHWVAEIGNGRASSNLAPEPVQNFYSDRNHKAYNLAAYIAPEWLRGLQVGGSYYRDRIIPPGIAPADQTIGSLYAVYMTPTWEFMNEGVLLSNRIENGGRTFNTPLAYTQLSRKFGAWRPYLPLPVRKFTCQRSDKHLHRAIHGALGWHPMGLLRLRRFQIAVQPLRSAEYEARQRS